MNADNLIPLASALVVVALPLLLGVAGWIRASTGSGSRPAVPWRWTPTVVSTLMCAIAFNLTFFIQEFFLVLPKALTPGLQPTLFHNNHLWNGANPLAALFQSTGALATFLTGTACALLLRHRRGSTTVAVGLLLFWMAYCGLFMALPQVVIGALTPQSDLGMTFTYFHLGAVAKAWLALAALAAIPLVAFALRRLLLDLAGSLADIAGARERSLFIFRTSTLPSLAAIPLIIPFRVPRDWIEVVMVPIVVIFAGGAWIQGGAWIRTSAHPLERPAPKSIAWPMGVLVSMLLFFQLVLRPGIRFTESESRRRFSYRRGLYVGPRADRISSHRLTAATADRPRLAMASSSGDARHQGTLMSCPLPRSAIAAALGLAVGAAAPVLAQETAVSFEDTFAEEGEGTDAERRKQRRNAQGNAAPWMGDAVRVTARGTAADWPSTLATDLLDWRDAIAEPSDFQDLITRVPGVGATGQNGLFETFSIRGSGGNEILILVGGMPVTSQRRAGVPVAFVEPSLLGDINVTRGPAVVHFGPGALGGAISIEPRWFDAATFSTGYATSGDEASVMAGIGSESFSIGAARHQAGDSQAPDGTPLNTSFERESATLQYRTRVGAFDLDALLMPSRTENIGKSNSRYPTRDTTYPEDSHTVGRLRLRHDSGFEASVHGHDQYLGTWNRRPGTPDTFAAISSTDIGATVQQSFDVGSSTNNAGIDYLGRRDVTGYDARGSVHNRTYSLDDASENNVSLFALTDWRLSPAFALELGGRRTWTMQEQSRATSRNADTAFTAGAAWTPSAASRWSLNLSSGYRFPTLEERFFTGVTAQGEIVGNADLASEHSVGVDLGYAWKSDAWGAEVHAWHMDVDDLIQLVDLSPDVNGYANVGEAELYGFETALGWTPTTDFSLRATAAMVRGRNKDTRDELYGIAPVTVALEPKYRIGDVSIGARYSHRWRANHPGFEEVGRDAVDVFDAEVRWAITSQVDLQFYVRNAFDENYYATADELSALAQERSIGFNLAWSAR